MNLAFDLENIRTTEFGISRKEEGDDQFVLIPVNRSVQTALHEMIETTWHNMQQVRDELSQYDPSEKHAPTEYLFLATDNPQCQRLVELHNADHLPVDADAVNEPDRISSYFVRLTDNGGHHLTAMRRAIQFKGDLKRKWVHLLDDTLQILERRVFRLDNDFDLIIDTDHVHIWRPAAFEFIGHLKQAVLDAVPANVEAVSGELPFVKFDVIQAYATEHLRAARYLASIRTQDLTGISCATLKALCQKTNVEISEINGQISVEERNVMGFLEVLDRRRYEIELVPDFPERFRAASRRRIDT